MALQNKFFLIFLFTIIIVRLFLYFNPIPAPTVKNFRFHHYMYGIILLILGLIIKNILLYSIGFGLFVDELTYLIIRGKTHEDNYSKKSIIGTIIFIIIVFLFRSYIVLYFV